MENANKGFVPKRNQLSESSESCHKNVIFMRAVIFCARFSCCLTMNKLQIPVKRSTFLRVMYLQKILLAHENFSQQLKKG